MEGANARSRLECLRCQQNQDNLHEQAYASLTPAYPHSAREPFVFEIYREACPALRAHYFKPQASLNGLRGQGVRNLNRSESNSFAPRLDKHTTNSLNCLLKGCANRNESNTFASRLDKHTSNSLNCLLKRCEHRNESNTFASRLNNHASKVLTRASSWRQPCLRSAVPANIFMLAMLCRREPS